MEENSDFFQYIYTNELIAFEYIQALQKKDTGCMYSIHVLHWPPFSNSGSEGLNEKHMQESFTQG